MFAKKTSQAVLSLFFKQPQAPRLLASAAKISPKLIEPLVKVPTQLLPLPIKSSYIESSLEAKEIIAAHYEASFLFIKYVSEAGLARIKATGKISGYVTTEKFTTGQEAEKKLQVSQGWIDGPIKYAIAINNAYATVLPAEPKGGQLKGVGFEVFTDSYPEHGVGGAVQGVLAEPILIDLDTFEFEVTELEFNAAEEAEFNTRSRVRPR